MTRAHDAVSALAAAARVVVLGGIAVVLHGLHRATNDIDIWLDPLRDSRAWADKLGQTLAPLGLNIARVSDQNAAFFKITFEDVAKTVERDRFVRVTGCERPIDVFREPANFAADDFDDVWERARPLDDGTRLLDEIDLVITKMHTGRPQDESDARFLQTKIESAYRERLRRCTPEDAYRLFERFVSPELAAFAATEAENGDVRIAARTALQELAASGDPYAAQLAEQLPE